MTIIAYDLETTRIESGTPRLLYLTAYGDDNYQLSIALNRKTDRITLFCDILEQHFLIPSLNKTMFIAWNGNKFDAYFIVQALLKSDKWIMQPYMTASKSLRGLKVKSRHTHKINGKKKVLQFQFLDGISMTGIAGKTLGQFINTFAPDFPKLTGVIDWDTEEFDPLNPAHVAYAERDSEGLYHAMKRVERIIFDLTGLPLKPTIGNLAINYFMKNIPAGIYLNTPSHNLSAILHGPVKRGGYCWCMKQYTGPVWKYDINQAYASAMRDARMPCGEPARVRDYSTTLAGIYEVTITRPSIPSLIPFYYKVDNDNAGYFTTGKESVTCWLTSIEIDHLRADQWDITVHDGYVWDNVFNFSAIIQQLENLRGTDPDGPSGSLGTMVKNIGNNAYGKTLEKLNGLELVIAADQPVGFDLYDPFDEENQFIFSRTRPVFRKPHHLPHIGVFITAHVRCKVRETALLAPDAFLYADTDCVVFTRPVELEIHKLRYGAWKVEAEGVRYIIIGKKIFYGEDGTTKAKGLQTRKLDRLAYENWLLGEKPGQTQIQRNNLLKFLSGHAMFKAQDRVGTDVSKSKIYGLDKESGDYKPRENRRTGKV